MGCFDFQKRIVIYLGLLCFVMSQLYHKVVCMLCLYWRHDSFHFLFELFNMRLLYFVMIHCCATVSVGSFNQSCYVFLFPIVQYLR